MSLVLTLGMSYVQFSMCGMEIKRTGKRSSAAGAHAVKQVADEIDDIEQVLDGLTACISPFRYKVD